MLRGMALALAMTLGLALGGGPRAAAQVQLNLELEPERIRLDFHGPGAESARVWRTRTPPRLIVDVPAVVEGRPLIQLEDPAAEGLRVALGEGFSRIVLDLRYDLGDHRVSADPDGATLSVEIDKVFQRVSSVRIAPGVQYIQQRRGERYGPLVVNILRIDLNDPRIRLGIGLAGREFPALARVSDLVRDHGAIAGVNAGFFANNGVPLGLIVQDGRLVSPPIYERTAFALTEDGGWWMERAALEAWIETPGEPVPVEGVNRRRWQGETVVFTPEFGRLTRGERGREWILYDGRIAGVWQSYWAPWPLRAPSASWLVLGDRTGPMRPGRPGDAAAFAWRLLRADNGAPLPAPVLAVGGGPRLVRDGAVAITDVEERFQADVAVGRSPRTLLGVTAADELLLVAVNGRQDRISVGMTLQEAAELLLELGAVQGMNLDGGHSTTMTLRDHLLLNLPSGGSERLVAAALLLLAAGD